jgi:hypothetical protein
MGRFLESRRQVFVRVFKAGALLPVLRARSSQDPQSPDAQHPKFPSTDDDPRLPDGKSQKNAIAKQQHEQALKEAENLITSARELRDQIKEAGTFVVPLDAVKKTEEIEKLAKRIRGRLKS